MFDYSEYDDDQTIKSQRKVDAESVDAAPSPDVPSVPAAYSTRYYAERTSTTPPPPPPQERRESAARERMKKRRVNKRSEWAWVIVAGSLFGVVILVSLLALLFVRSAQENTEVIPTAVVAAEDLPTPVLAYRDFGDDSDVIGGTLEMPDGSTIELLPWDGQSRFTMVLVGLDRRPGETGLAYRTDTMMLVSLDPETDRIGVLSIPRDLYIQVPGYGTLYRVNSPMVLGETRREGYGPELMMQSVQLNLGIRVHDYMAVDFQAFIDIVDAIGGVDVAIDYTINDSRYPSMNYGYDPFYLPAGEHHLDGYDALRFARTRHGSSDIQRAERQQQVIYAIRDRILTLEMIPQLLVQAPAMWQSFSDNVYTGLSLEQIINLGLYVKDVPLDNITMNVIDYKYLQSHTTSEGAQVLIPNRARLGSLMVETFGENYCKPDC